MRKIFPALIFLGTVFGANEDCLDPSDPTGEYYDGKIHRSSSGRKCKRWGRKQS